MVRPGTVLLVTNMGLKPSNLPAGDESNAKKGGSRKKKVRKPHVVPTDP